MLKKVGWGLGIIFVLTSPITVRTFIRAPSVDVNVEPVLKRVIRDSILSSGNLIYKDEARLSPEIIAQVKTVLVNEGDKVEKGQILLHLDDQDIREAISLQEAQVDIDAAIVEQQKINLSNAKMLYDRFSTLIKKNLVSQDNYDNAYYELKTAQSNLTTSKLTLKRSKVALQQAKKQLRQTIIRSPISGTVVAIDIEPGETAVPSATGIPGSSLITIAKEESILVDLNVDENDIANISFNDEVLVNCPTLPNEGLNGNITDIAISPRNVSGNFAANDTVARSYSVRVKIGNTSGYGLRAGMSCRAKIYTSNPDPFLSVPVQAVLSDRLSDDDGISMSQINGSEDERYVFVAVNGRAEKRVVLPGIADDQYLEIQAGLKEGERVITGPSRVLSSIFDQTPIDPSEVPQSAFVRVD